MCSRSSLRSTSDPAHCPRRSVHDADQCRSTCSVIRDSVTYTEHAKRKTVTSLDVVYALKRSGRTLYGVRHLLDLSQLMYQLLTSRLLCAVRRVIAARLPAYHPSYFTLSGADSCRAPPSLFSTCCIRPTPRLSWHLLQFVHPTTSLTHLSYCLPACANEWAGRKV